MLEQSGHPDDQSVDEVLDLEHTNLHDRLRDGGVTFDVVEQLLGVISQLEEFVELVVCTVSDLGRRHGLGHVGSFRVSCRSIIPAVKGAKRRKRKDLKHLLCR